MKGAQKMKIIIDRFEGEFAVCELSDGSFQNLPRAFVPEGAGEGAVIEITYNSDETEKKLSDMQKRLNRLFRD